MAEDCTQVEATGRAKLGQVFRRLDCVKATWKVTCQLDWRAFKALITDAMMTLCSSWVKL